MPQNANNQMTSAAPHPTSRTQEALLLEFLREHDAECPSCGYNLRGLTRPVCPECRQDLVLAVGVKRLRLEWLLVAVAPGFFSGIAAVFVLVPIIGMVLNGGLYSLTLIAMDAFGWCSGAVAILLAVKRTRFLAMPRRRQRWVALSIWAVHVIAFALLLLVGPAYL